ncbi:MAG: DUF2835 family protein [Gammaproteobacteria bacterium]|nr:MAG: DUF2835 family protein [Gammaproteobacteria bacterium]
MIHRFRIDIDAHTWQEWYRGAARRVRVRTEAGLIIEFPAERLIPHVTHEGIHGQFELYTTDDNRFVSLRRLDASA